MSFAKSAKATPASLCALAAALCANPPMELPMKKIAILLLLYISGCSSILPSSIVIDSAISEYQRVENQISLGDDSEYVLGLLLPIQEKLPPSNRKSPEKYIRDGVNVEIYYIRSGRQPDGLTTDDEFTPYIFNDGKLVGIGWQLLGGPTSRGQVTPTTVINTEGGRERDLQSGGGVGRTSSTGLTGRFVRESTSGFNKTCYYSSIRGEFTKTVGSTQLCPLSATQ
jgi:hypothetical protein